MSSELSWSGQSELKNKSATYQIVVRFWSGLPGVIVLSRVILDLLLVNELALVQKLIRLLSEG